MAFTEDISEFFDADTGFAETATIGASSVSGHFSEPSADEATVGGTRPTFECDLADLPAGYETANIVIRGRTFRLAGAADLDISGKVATLSLQEQG